MALIDHWDRRALILAAVPLACFVVLVVRCLLPPSLGLGSTLPFAGVLCVFYGPVTWFALFRAWGRLWPTDWGLEKNDGFWPPARRIPLGGLWPAGLLVLFTLWVTRWYWILISIAGDNLQPDMGWFGFRDPDWVRPTGLDLFGETLLVMGVILPLIVVGILWVLLPKRP